LSSLITLALAMALAVARNAATSRLHQLQYADARGLSSARAN
jgi:hypothetical protein